MTRQTFIALFVFATFFSVIISTNEYLVEVESIQPHVPGCWKDLGETSADQEIELFIAIKQTNLAQLHGFINAVSAPKSSSYGRYKTIEEIKEMVKPKSSEILKIKRWLINSDIDDIEMYDVDWMKIKSTASKINSLLSIQLHSFIHHSNNMIVHRSLTNYRIPSSVASSIDFISDILRFPSFHKRMEHQTSGEKIVSFVTPESIQNLYNITIPAANQNLQAVASFLGQYYSTKDLSTFETKFDLPQTQVEKTIGFNDESQPGIEASLDVQYLMGISNCSIRTWVFSTNGTTPSENEPFLKWLLSLSLYSSLPNLISMSYQDYEYTVSREYAVRVCNEFAKYTATGITFITGSGDWGVGCFDSYSCTNFTADFPSSCPYVISTGATTLSLAGTEEGVAFSSGGFSNYFAQPDYQSAAVSQFLQSSDLPPSSFFNSSGRAFPDVAAIGTNFAVFVDGVEMPVGGTSAATPTFGSILAMINTQRLNAGLPTLGYALPFLYQAAATNSLAYQDITAGERQDTGCCGKSFTTTEGWDPYTGLGTPNAYILSQLAMDSSFFNFPAPQ